MATSAALRLESTVAFLEGDLILDNAVMLLAESRKALKCGICTFDLSQTGHMDSSAISLLLGIRRSAESAGQTIALQAVPESLKSLATLYGVAEYL